MVNAWSLAASILDGTFEEDYPLMEKSKKGWSEEDEIRELDDYYDFENVGSGNTAHSDYYYDYTRNDPDAKNPFTEAFDYLMGESVTEKTPWIYESPDGGKTVYKYERGTDPLKRELVDLNIEMADIDDQYAHHFEQKYNVHFGKNTVSPYITKTFKYEEDAILKQAEEYIAKTYELHYTSDKGNYQTLDLIESIGDAEAFCRSNAIKYLSRFGKKDGKNRKDILKAIHYCTLLYHFSFNDNSN